MPLPAPMLDDRQFQTLVDEAKKRIPHYCKEWTDHNVSDPGVTLIELFAWMTDILIYRLNKVPDLHYIRFMEMLGINLREPIPAKTLVTFWLTKPQELTVLIPAGTEVASTQTEKERSIIFTTERDFKIQPPQLNTVLSSASGRTGRHFTNRPLKELTSETSSFEVFSPRPLPDDALYFGFENDLSQHILGIEMNFEAAEAAGVNPDLPPYIWEVSPGNEKDEWLRCEVEQDTTRVMNTAGRVQLHLPDMGKIGIEEKELYWVRVRILHPDQSPKGTQPFDVSPRLKQAAVESWGGSTSAIHAQQISRETLGRSDGTPGGRYQLQMRPLLERLPDETLHVLVEGEPPQIWKEVHDFADSNQEDRHFTLDSVTGELRLGPAIRQPDGTIKMYGAIPPRGAALIFNKYRYGGGQEGNVEAGILNTLKTAIPYIARVVNRKPAWGGLDAETLEDAMTRAPALLRSRDRAVTEFDYEFLARQALPAAIGRVKCLQPRTREAEQVVPALVYVLVIPRIPRPEGRHEQAQLEPKAEDVAKLSAYLDERRLLTTRVNVRPPAYIWVSVRVELRAAPNTPQAQIEANVLARLYRFLNPLTGGLEGTGWPFGRDLFISDVYQCLQGLPDVQFIRSVEMFQTQSGGEPRGTPAEVIEVFAHGVVASGVHRVSFV